MVFVHGFGCDQNMWVHVWPAFTDEYRVVLLDLVGAGGSDLSGYDNRRYSSLQAHASDIVDVLVELDLQDVVFVGHSVSAMIGALASLQDSPRFGELVMIGPSPRYIDEDGYVGGFSQDDIDELLESLASNYLGWSRAMAPAIAGSDNGPAGQELTDSFCRMDPDIAEQFARTTFLSDNRSDLPRITTPTLILQCADDLIAPQAVGAYTHAQIPGSTLVQLNATGHCPNLSAPQETVAAIRDYLDR
jgi:sigma-B regulation protein RsbQ